MTTHLWEIKIGGFTRFEKTETKFIIPSIENINFINNLLNLDLSKFDYICAEDNYSKINLEIRSNKKIISEIEFEESNIFHELILFCRELNNISNTNNNPSLTIICGSSY